MKKAKAKPRPKTGPKAFNYKKDVALRRKLFLKSLAAVNKLKAELGLGDYPVTSYSPSGTDAHVHVNHWMSPHGGIEFGIDFGLHLMGINGGKPLPETEPYFLVDDREATKAGFVLAIKKWAGKRVPFELLAEQEAAYQLSRKAAPTIKR